MVEGAQAMAGPLRPLRRLRRHLPRCAGEDQGSTRAVRGVCPSSSPYDATFATSAGLIRTSFSYSDSSVLVTRSGV